MRTLLIYVLLVGAPLAGLLAVLHAGAELQPPPHIAGLWLPQADVAAGTATAVAGESQPCAVRRLAVEQSGQFLNIEVLTDAAAPVLASGKARLSGDDFEVRMTVAHGECRGRSLHLTGRANADGTKLWGHIDFDCDRCIGGSFHAARTSSS